MQVKDYYKILGINFNATETDIKVAYKNLALKFHPDINHFKEAEAIFKEINEAYEILSDKNKRENYDRLYSDKLKNGHKHNDQIEINEDENLNIFDPRGKLHRLNYFCINFVCNFIFNKYNDTISTNITDNITLLVFFLNLLIIALVFYIQICAVIKRLNDVKSSRWLAIFTLVPIVNIALGIYLLFTPANYKKDEVL